MLQWRLWGEVVLAAYSNCELVGLLYMCYNGVSGHSCVDCEIVWHCSEPEALLHLEGGLEAAAANDSEED